MTTKEFIQFVAEIAVRDWIERRIMLPSIVIAQALKESAKGTSELAVNANAIFGIKLNGWTGKSYRKKADEQNPDGTFRTDLETLWRAYDNWEQSIIDHNTYIAERKVGNQTEPNFLAIIGETNVKKVLAGFVGDSNRSATAKRCTDPELQKFVLEGKSVFPYATGLDYPQSLLDDYILKYDLTQYDKIEEVKPMLKIAISAGHGLNTAGKRCMKKLDPNETREWTLNSRDANNLEKLLKDYDCEVLRVDDRTGKKDISNSDRAKVANAWGADIYIAFHHDAGKYGKRGGGIIVFYSSSKAERVAQAKTLYNSLIATTGLKGDRSNPVQKKGFTEIAKANAPSFLIENGFMDSVDDVPVILTEAHSEKTARGVLNFLVNTWGLKKKVVADTESNGKLYRVQVGAFSSKENAENLKRELEGKGYKPIIV